MTGPGVDRRGGIMEKVNEEGCEFCRAKPEEGAIPINGCKLTENRYVFDGQVWLVSSLLEHAKGLEPFDLPLKHIHIDESVWKISSAVGLVEHLVRVMKTDLSHPVIMDQDGFIMDGWHRVAKALFLGRASVKAVRFEVTPPCDFRQGS